MNHAGLVAVLAAVVAVVASSGCSSSSEEGGDITADSGSPAEDADGVDSSTGGDAGDAAEGSADTRAEDTRPVRDTAVRDTTPPPEPDTALPDTTPPPGACNAVTVSALAPYHRVVAAAPKALGGTLLDGDYVLVDYSEYGSPVDETHSNWLAERIVITGSVVQAVIQVGATSPPDWLSMRVATSGTSYTLTKTCGPGDPETGLTYTATPTELAVYDNFAGHDRRFLFSRTATP